MVDDKRKTPSQSSSASALAFVLLPILIPLVGCTIGQQYCRPNQSRSYRMVPEVRHDETGGVEYDANNEVDPEIETVSLVCHHFSACAV